MTEQIFLGIRDFIQPYLPLLNSYNVDYLTCNHWNTYVPDWIRQEDTVDLYDLFEKRYKETSPANNLLEELIDQMQKYEDELKLLKNTTRTFMSPKKEHEVEILVPITNQLANMVDIDSIIDYGSVRGYLGYYSEYDPCSFPLSHRLIQEKTKLGRNARMLAAQSFERNKADQTLNAGLWYRALMQVLVKIYELTTGLQDIKLGKFIKESMTFEEYARKALGKLKLDKTKVPTASSYLVTWLDPIKLPRCWCLGTAQRDVNVNYSEVQKDLLIEKHCSFLIRYGRSNNMHEYGATDYRGMRGIYWLCTRLDLLHSLKLIDQEHIIEYIQKCYNKNSGGYSPCPNHDPHLLYALLAVQLLVQLNRTDLIDKQSLCSYIKQLQQDDGSFIGNQWGEIDTRFSFCAVACLKLIDSLDTIDIDRATNFIMSFLNFDGGFCCIPGAESHAEQIYCCLGFLSLVQRLDNLDLSTRNMLA
ncbi:unnamed protein product [Rotaria magnacalcarata]